MWNSHLCASLPVIPPGLCQRSHYLLRLLWTAEPESKSHGCTEACCVHPSKHSYHQATFFRNRAYTDGMWQYACSHHPCETEHTRLHPKWVGHRTEDGSATKSTPWYPFTHRSTTSRKSQRPRSPSSRIRTYSGLSQLTDRHSWQPRSPEREGGWRDLAVMKTKLGESDFLTWLVATNLLLWVHFSFLHIGFSPKNATCWGFVHHNLFIYEVLPLKFGMEIGLK